MAFRYQTWGILGTGIHHGQPKSGVERAYSLLSTEGVFRDLKDQGVMINDHGDLASQLTDQPYTELYEKIQQLIKFEETPLWIGGDHSQAFSTISALVDVHPDLKVLWFDAHGDINTPASSPSGNLHGMPLAGLLGIADKSEFKMPWLNQSLKPENVALIGIRDLDRMEMKWIKDNGVLHYSAVDVKAKGMSAVVSEISKAWDGSGPVHLSFDIDGLDSSIVPATGTPVNQGIFLDAGKELLRLSKETFDLISCEVVELNPSLAKSPLELETTLSSVTEVLRTLMLES